MTTPAAPPYPVPDQSDQLRIHTKDGDGVIDIGWSEDVMSDGRPFRTGMWAQYQVSMPTLFFSTRGHERLEGDELRALVVNTLDSSHYAAKKIRQ